MSRVMNLNGRMVGDGAPCWVIAEIGINHNGSLEAAMKLVDMAKQAGCDAVKFQKRTPEKCVPADQRDKMRETPWGYISYMEYRHKVEFGREEFERIDNYCRAQKIAWFVSCWDSDSVEFMKQFKTPCIKIPSASLTDRELLESCKASGQALMLSTGMSSMDQINAAVKLLGTERLLLAHATSTYPCPKEQLNLRMMTTLREQFSCPIGYSGHEVGLVTTVAAVALGACFVERHITLDRASWGSDQAASIEPQGMRRLVKDIRSIETAMGDGVKHVYQEEQVAASRLRLRNTL
ncbi:MAG TPA: N-acetylneuraminate synthase family protein [Pirellulales bacterium]|nr:N-acetylneuraminate synthase family protein [Pirellulales bacterium]